MNKHIVVLLGPTYPYFSEKFKRFPAQLLSDKPVDNVKTMSNLKIKVKAVALQEKKTGQ